MAQAITEQERDYYLLPGSERKATSDEAIRFLLLAENDDQVPKRFVKKPGSDDYIEDPDWLSEDDCERIHRTRPHSRALDQYDNTLDRHRTAVEPYFGHLPVDGQEKVRTLLENAASAIRESRSLTLGQIGFLIGSLEDLMRENYMDLHVVYRGWTEFESTRQNKDESFLEFWQWIADYRPKRLKQQFQETTPTSESINRVANEGSLLGQA